jgi:hypothetical protein
MVAPSGQLSTRITVFNLGNRNSHDLESADRFVILCTLAFLLAGYRDRGFPPPIVLPSSAAHLSFSTRVRCHHTASAQGGTPHTVCRLRNWAVFTMVHLSGPITFLVGAFQTLTKGVKGMSTLRDTFLEELADIYDAEKQLTKALSKMANAARNHELKSGFEHPVTQTEGRLSRLEDRFQTSSSWTSKCRA